jgi:hypothetical protein
MSAAGRPSGRGDGRASAALSRLGEARRRDALHLPAWRSRQKVNLFLREPLDIHGNDFRIEAEGMLARCLTRIIHKASTAVAT